MKASLIAGDIPALGFALRHDEMVVPLFYTPEGEEQFRVFPSNDKTGQKPFSFAIFSSPDELEKFLGVNAELRVYQLMRMDDIVSFLQSNHAVLDRVYFDPGSTHTISANVDDTLRMFEPRLFDDEWEWSLTGSHLSPKKD